MANPTGVSELLAKADRKTVTKYIQFSKRIVAGVTIAVTLIIIAAIALCYSAEDTSSIVGLVGAYCNFALVVFASYSVNAISEKCIKAWSASQSESEDDEDEEG